MELLSTPEVICGEASLTAGWLLDLAARDTDGGLSDTDLDSDLAGRHTCGLKTQDLLLFRRADRTTGRLADTASRVVSLASVVGDTLDEPDSGATSPTMRRLRKASGSSHSLVKCCSGVQISVPSTTRASML